ncbi:hypothetical protein ACFLXY_06445 [Chloroflexota bacterium]
MSKSPGVLDPEDIKQFELLKEKSRALRGEIIERTTEAERLIESIIVFTFFPLKAETENGMLLGSVVLRELSSRNKITILRKLLKLRHQEVLKNHPKFIDDILYIFKFRNRLAHTALDTSPEFINKRYEDRIRLYLDEDGKRKTINIFDKDIDMYRAKCTGIVTKLVKIVYEINEVNNPDRFSR